MKRQVVDRVAKKKQAARRSEREYRGPQYTWPGFSMVANWRANPSLAPKIYQAIKTLTAFPFSATVLRHLDIKLGMVWNAKSTGARKRGRDDRIEFSPTEMQHATGYSRRVCREGFRSLSMAGSVEQGERRRRVVFRPREITHEQALAFLGYMETHGALPPSDWWGQAGTSVPKSGTPDMTPLTSGTTLPPVGHQVTAMREPSDRTAVLGDRQNEVNPLQDSDSAAEEVEQGEEEKNPPAAPPASEPAARAGDGRQTPPLLRWPNGTGCRLCGSLLDAIALNSDDPAVEGYCRNCRSE